MGGGSVVGIQGVGVKATAKRRRKLKGSHDLSMSVFLVWYGGGCGVEG